jgi:hypothetical protein
MSFLHIFSLVFTFISKYVHSIIRHVFSFIALFNGGLQTLLLSQRSWRKFYEVLFMNFLRNVRQIMFTKEYCTLEAFHEI